MLMLVVDIHHSGLSLLRVVVLRHHIVKLFRCVYTMCPPQYAAESLSQMIKH